MQIHIARGGQKLGEFSQAEVQAKVNASELRATDLAWAEGRAEWVPLSAFPGINFPSVPPAIPATPSTPSAPPLPTFRPAAASTPTVIPGTPKPKASSGLAAASLVFAILSLCLLPIVAAIPAIICGHLALSEIKRSAGTIGGGGMALAGTIIGYLSFVMIIPVAIAIALPVYGEVQVRGKEVKSLSNAKQIALACKIYALDHEGAFPKTLEELVPEYLPDRATFVCPMSPGEPIGFVYLGGRDSDPEDNVLIYSKTADRRGRRAVVRVNASGAIEQYDPSLEVR